MEIFIKYIGILFGLTNTAVLIWDRYKKRVPKSEKIKKLIDNLKSANQTDLIAFYEDELNRITFQETTKVSLEPHKQKILYEYYLSKKKNSSWKQILAAIKYFNFKKTPLKIEISVFNYFEFIYFSFTGLFFVVIGYLLTVIYADKAEEIEKLLVILLFGVYSLLLGFYTLYKFVSPFIAALRLKNNRKMNKNRLIQRLLASANFICILLILQIKLKLIPLIPCKCSIEYINGINETLLNLSFGIIVSSIFYLIVVVIPARKKRDILKRTIQPRLDLMVQELYVSFFYLADKYFKSTENLQELELSDFSSITGLSNNQMNFRFHYKGETNSIHHLNDTELDHFISQKEGFQETINSFFTLPHFDNLPIELTNCFAQIRDCQFYRSISTQELFKSALPIKDFSKHLYDYYKLYKDLLIFSKFEEIEK